MGAASLIPNIAARRAEWPVVYHVQHTHNDSSPMLIPLLYPPSCSEEWLVIYPEGRGSQPSVRPPPSEDSPLYKAVEGADGPGASTDAEGRAEDAGTAGNAILEACVVGGGSGGAEGGAEGGGEERGHGVGSAEGGEGASAEGGSGEGGSGDGGEGGDREGGRGRRGRRLGRGWSPVGRDAKAAKTGAEAEAAVGGSAGAGVAREGDA